MTVENGERRPVCFGMPSWVIGGAEHERLNVDMSLYFALVSWGLLAQVVRAYRATNGWYLNEKKYVS